MPDFVVRKLKNTHFIDLHVIGEVKGQDAENDTFVNLVYLMRIGLLSKDAIDNNLHKGIIGIQAVGLFTTVYVTSLVGGRDVSQMRAYTSLCEDLLYLTRLSKTCLEQVESPSQIKSFIKPGIRSPTFKDLIRTNKNRKKNHHLLYDTTGSLYLV